MRIGAVVGLSMLLGTSSAQAEEPATGAAEIGGGAAVALAGIGVLYSAAACPALPVGSTEPPKCLYGVLGAGSAVVAASIPLFVIGAQKRAKWAAWASRLHVGATLAGGSLAWSGSF